MARTHDLGSTDCAPQLQASASHACRSASSPRKSLRLTRLISPISTPNTVYATNTRAKGFASAHKDQGTRGMRRFIDEGISRSHDVIAYQNIVCHLHESRNRVRVAFYADNTSAQRGKCMVFITNRTVITCSSNGKQNSLSARIAGVHTYPSIHPGIH
jgi:hypothetical protein